MTSKPAGCDASLGCVVVLPVTLAPLWRPLGQTDFAAAVALAAVAVLWWRLSEVAGRRGPRPLPAGVVLLAAAVLSTWRVNGPEVRHPVAAFAAFATGAVLGGGAIRDVERHWGPWWAPMAVVTCGALYSTVPDTERALALMGAVVGLCAVSVVVRVPLRLGATAWAFGAMVLFVAIDDGWERRSAVIGGAATLGLFVIEPLARRLVPAARRAGAGPPRRVRIASLVAIHTGFALFAARVAGLERHVGTSLVLLVPAAGAAVAAVVVFAPAP
jgi:hypothetical protein